MITAKESRRTFLCLLPAGVVLLTLPWLSGCVERVELGSEPVPGITPASSAQIPDGMAELYLINDLVAMFGLERHSAKIVNGAGRRAIVDLEPREYARFFISPGPHTLKLLLWGALTKWAVAASITINATPGVTYYVVAKLILGFKFTPHFSLDQVSKEEASSLIEKMIPQ